MAIEASREMVVHVDGQAVTVPAGVCVVAALVLADGLADALADGLAQALCTRRSVTGEARFALCGMGYCQECRVTIDGQPHQLACQRACRAGMVIATGAGSPA